MPLGKKLFLVMAIPIWLSVILFFGVFFISARNSEKIEKAVNEMQTAASADSTGKDSVGSGLAILLRLKLDDEQFSKTMMRVAVVVITIGALGASLTLYVVVNSLIRYLDSIIRRMDACADGFMEVSQGGSSRAAAEMEVPVAVLMGLTREMAVLVGGSDFKVDGLSQTVKPGDVVSLDE